MKQRLILFSALLILSLSLGVASAAEDELLINVTHNGTGDSFIPGDVVKITADFNRSVDQATLSVYNTMSPFADNVSMMLKGDNEIGGNSFEYEYEIPYGIVAGPLDLNISAFNASSIVGSKIVDSAFVFDPTKYLNTGIQLNRTSYRPGDVVNITANFSQPVDHANISIGNNASNNLAGASLVGADLVTDFPMTEIGDNTFAYNYLIPDGTSSPLNIDISAFDIGNNLLGENSFPGEIGVGDPYITIVSPTSNFANEKCVTFNFTAYDYIGYGQNGSQLVYTFWLDGSQVNNGVITSGSYKQLQFDLADGKHTWEVQTVDGMKQEHTTGTRTLYVDTKCPSVTLTSPQDCFKQVIGDTQFNFTCEDALAAQYSDLGLTYTLYVDGQVAKRYVNYGNNITGTAQSGTPVTQKVQLDDGAHNWSVSVQDGAGNSVTSEVRKFYVDLNGLNVSSVSPNGGYVSANPKFNFTVTGATGYGAGLPFDYKLLVDGKEVKASNCGDCNCNGEYNSNDGENGCVGCSDGECDGSCFVVGSGTYSITASVADGVNKNWTVVITDTTTGKTYQTNLKTFSVDSVAPAAVEHLYSQDKPGNTYWTYLTNSPGLDVYWLPNNETDLATKPYEVYISTSKPSCIEDMELVNTTYLPIDEILKCGGEPLVYGKDYWVAVIARDNASNYNKNFSVYGPVQTYEDMEITLNEGWNLKSVPKRVVDDCPESVFGADSTVLYWDGSCWQFPDTIEPCKGYWVYTNYSCTTNVKLKGMSSDSCNPDVPPSLTLTPGWHMIGHTATYTADWPTTLSSLGESFLGVPSSFKFSNLITYDQNEGWGGIISDNYQGLLSGSSQVTGQYIYGNSSMPVGALQSDQCMVPGQGYWIFMKDEGIYGSIENVNLTAQDTNTGTGTGNGTETGNGTIPFDPSNIDPSNITTPA